jgi:hypothetical protein
MTFSSQFPPFFLVQWPLAFYPTLSTKYFPHIFFQPSRDRDSSISMVFLHHLRRAPHSMHLSLSLSLSLSRGQLSPSPTLSTHDRRRPPTPSTHDRCRPPTPSTRTVSASPMKVNFWVFSSCFRLGNRMGKRDFCYFVPFQFFIFVIVWFLRYL